jgi:hypothetical protein
MGDPIRFTLANRDNNLHQSSSFWSLCGMKDPNEPGFVVATYEETLRTGLTELP